MIDKPTEYEFTLLDGSKRYEMVYEIGEAFQFQRMHKARAFKPVPRDIGRDERCDESA